MNNTAFNATIFLEMYRKKNISFSMKVSTYLFQGKVS